MAPGGALYLGLDLGTSACRALVIDDAGAIHAQAAAPLPTPRRRNAEVEQDPALWWRAVCMALDDLGARMDLRRVAALAVDGTSGTLLLTDGDGAPLGAALMYNDARSTAEAARIAQLAPPASAAHGASGALAKLLRLQNSATPAARHALSQADWISARFGGHYGVADENNCLKLGFDPLERNWPAWLDALGVRRELLPRTVPAGTALGCVSAAVARQFNLNPAARVVAGTTDSTAAFIASGATRPGEAVTSLGSTLVLKVISERPLFAPRHGVYSHRLGDLWLAGGGSNSGGAVLLHYFSAQQLADMTPRLQPDHPTGLDYYPLLAPGERFPINDAQFAPRLTPRPKDDVRFFQGMLEGMARIEQQGYQLLARLGAPYPVTVRSAGGGALNAAWRTLRERALGVPVIAAAQREAAYGAAVLARRGVTQRDSKRHL
ncbi:MAG: FGGY-family carbohydrate kinase [Pseudomonadota bacterium]